MSTQATIESQREGAEVYYGAEVCRQKSRQLLAELHLPSGLLPMAELEEVGRNPATGFVWLRQKKAITHTFKKIGKPVSYATDVTAFVEDRRMRRLTGVKAKELLIWVTLTDFYIDDPASGKITFKSSTGIGRTFPVSAFEEDAAAAE